MKKINLILAIFVGIFFLTGCRNEKANQDNWSSIKEEKKIIIGLDDTFVPMGFRDKDGKLTGFDIDLATAVFKEYGINVEFQPIDWSMKEFELNNGTIDLIWNGYSKTAERAKKVQFTKPYMQNEQELITTKKSGIISFAQMKGKVLGHKMALLVMMRLLSNRKS